MDVLRLTICSEPNKFLADTTKIGSCRINATESYRSADN